MNDRFWLITLPHAGGSSNIFKGWDKNLNCNILNVEYPGHWTRLKEPLVATFKELEDDVINSILRSIEVNSHILIFGHSLGAIIAWKIAKRLCKNNIFVVGLFLSASQNPGSFPEEKITNLHSDDDVLELINYHNNTDDNALDGRVKKLFLPIIKNDLKICQECKLNYEYCNISSLIFYGLEDPFTNIDEVEKWNRYVKCDSIIGLPGKHFYFQQKENQRIIFEQINKFIENWNGR